MSNSERIIAILEYCNMKAGDFAETVGVAPATISNLKNEKTSFTAAIAKKINMSFPEISFQWILLGEGNMLQSTENKQINSSLSSFKRHTDELFPLDTDDGPEKTDAVALNNISSVSHSSKPETYSKPEVLPSIDKTTVASSVVNTNAVKPNNGASASQQRSIEKIIIYYSDKTFEEYDMTKCKL